MRETSAKVRRFVAGVLVVAVCAISCVAKEGSLSGEAPPFDASPQWQTRIEGEHAGVQFEGQVRVDPESGDLCGRVVELSGRIDEDSIRGACMEEERLGRLGWTGAIGGPMGSSTALDELYGGLVASDATALRVETASGETFAAEVQDGVWVLVLPEGGRLEVDKVEIETPRGAVRCSVTDSLHFVSDCR